MGEGKGGRDEGELEGGGGRWRCVEGTFDGA